MAAVLYPSADLHCAKLQQRPAKKARAPSLPTTFRRNCLRLDLPPFQDPLSFSFPSTTFAKGLFFLSLVFAVREARCFARFFLSSFSSSCQGFVFPSLRTWLELFESIAVTNVAVINWNRLRNSGGRGRGGGSEGEEKG